MIVISGCVDGALAESYTHQIFDHAALMRPITKATLRALAGTEDLVVAKALAIAQHGRPGPVHIDLPINVAEAQIHERTPIAMPVMARMSPAVTAKTKAMLVRAVRPLIIAGLDLVIENGAAHLKAFAELIGAPVLATYKAKGLLPHDHPLFVGAIGLSPKADAIVKPLIEASDLIILAGYDPIEMRAGWRNPWPADKPVIELVAEQMPHGMHASTIIYEAHVSTVLAALGDAQTTGQEPKRGWPDDAPARTKAKLREAFAVPADKPWGPHQVFAILRAVTPTNTVATADSGAHRILLSQMWDCALPRTLLQSSGFCTMGGALPLAAGHALATGQHSLCFVGDAGLEMVLGELATLRDLDLPVVVVVLVDRALALIEIKQRQMQLPRQGVDFGATDFAAVGIALGGHGVNVSSSSELELEAKNAFQRKGFAIIAAQIGDRAYDGAF